MRRTPWVSGMGLAAAVMLAAALPAFGPAAAAPAADAPVLEYSSSGSGSAAAEFNRVIAAHPDHPAGHFFLAAVEWWRIMADIENTAYDDNFIFFIAPQLETIQFQLLWLGTPGKLFKMPLKALEVIDDERLLERDVCR